VRLRAPETGDLGAVYKVIAARDTADLGAPDYTLEDLREEWQMPGFDLSEDARVAEDGSGRLVAYGVVRSSGSLALVAPDAEGAGTGSRLLEWVERREDELRRSCHRQSVAASNQSARALLTGAGYELARSNYRMVRSLDGEQSEIAAPANVALRSLDPIADARSIHAVDGRSFAADPGYVPETFASFNQEHLAAHDLDPGLSVVAERADGEVVGFLLARRWEAEGVGYVDILAVDPFAQRQGLGAAMLGRAFALFAAAGLREAQLGVSSDNPRALRLYERMGMRPRFRSDVYERPSDR